MNREVYNPKEFQVIEIKNILVDGTVAVVTDDERLPQGKPEIEI